MAYETPLLQTDNYDPWQAPDLHDAHQYEINGPLVRPYVGNPTQEDLGITPYDPLTAPLEEVAIREFGSAAAYNAAPTIWDRQAEQAYQDQMAHGRALARTIALQSMKRVAEYRANFPTDTDTLQLRIVEPGPSSVDVALAELDQIRQEIAWHIDHPPMFSTAQTLHAKYDHEQTLQLRIPETSSVLPPANSDSGMRVLSLADTSPSCSPDGCGAPGAPPPVPPATVREPARSSEASATQRVESELAGESRVRPRRKLGPIGRKASEILHTAALSAHGARKLISRITRQAVLWG